DIVIVIVIVGGLGHQRVGVSARWVYQRVGCISASRHQIWAPGQSSWARVKLPWWQWVHWPRDVLQGARDHAVLHSTRLRRIAVPTCWAGAWDAMFLGLER